MSNGTTTNASKILGKPLDLNIKVNNHKEEVDKAIKSITSFSNFESPRITAPKFERPQVSLSGNLLPYYTVMYSLHRVNSKEA
ncbi:MULTISPECIES: hypothetical protein [Staphylococcus]|uniref:Uncharacterized protein n=1 Tax=Staphylococcus ureilyticus TaxID=94138 RepID=A0AB34AFL9_STAUR|nr:hypothetical protein [Staphylococcus ureilyticus]QKU17395.1 hypothetical protein FOC52_00685 [Staphylococcus cohnii]MCT1914037.1 hypothetical protein [Staphylococcus ureilyticus]OJT35360.1 hypothetical protein BSF33_04715 [Staphylococcus ureilyticus]PNZ47781.1 hypothetical protein CD150_01465 [Staphylococcus ureilyticus]RNM28041.1 hypothetical protein EFY80_04520 [Staphylococcus cohnii]